MDIIKIEKDGTNYIVRKIPDIKNAPIGTKFGYLWEGTLYTYMELSLMGVLDEMVRVEVLWYYPEEKPNEFPKYITTKIK